MNNKPASTPCKAPNQTVFVRPFAPPPCTHSYSGDVFADLLVVRAGQTACVNNAKVSGQIIVAHGGALTVTASQIGKGIYAARPAFLSVCGSTVIASSSNPTLGIRVVESTVPLRIGDPARSCPANKVVGDINVTQNSGGVVVGANSVSRDLIVVNNTVGGPVIKANTIAGRLGCFDNDPPPVNSGQPNAASTEEGQCVGL